MEELFSKSLTKIDIEKRLSVPVKCLKLLPCFGSGHKVDIQAEDENGRNWIFRCSIRKRSYLKPVLSKGWRKFVVVNDLNIGDKVKFYKEKDQAVGLKYKIQVKKAIKVFGAIFEPANDDL